jgi:hypothetical protein
MNHVESRMPRIGRILDLEIRAPSPPGIQRRDKQFGSMIRDHDEKGRASVYRPSYELDMSSKIPVCLGG